MYPFELKKRRNAICHDVTAEQIDQHAKRMTDILRNEPNVALVTSYDNRCHKDSAEAVEKVSELGARRAIKRRHTNSVGATLTELEESLAKLPEECPLRRLPNEALLRIISLLPMTSVLALATTCRTFNAIINEQRHGIKNVNKISVDFDLYRNKRVVVVSVHRRSTDKPCLIERYAHCSRVPVDTEKDDILFKRRCSPEGVSWVANILPALLVNANVSSIEFIGEHGVNFDHAMNFLRLTCKREPFNVEKMTFVISSSKVTTIHHCKFWIMLLQPRTLSLRAHSGYAFIHEPDYNWLFSQQVDRIVIQNNVNLRPHVISQLIRDWYIGKRRRLPTIELTFLKPGEAEFEVEEFLKRVKYDKMNEAGGVSALVTRRVDGDVKQISKITTMVSDQSGDSLPEHRLVIRDFWNIN